MPFTVSHAAAVLPLRSPRWPFTALVAGSMAPDLPYFVHLPVGQGMTHSILGIPTIDLAMAIAAVAVWHALLAPGALALAPQAVRARCPEARSWPSVLRNAGWPAVIAACIAGATTHVAWDAFTHPDRWGTRRIDWLMQLHGGHMGYTWAQYASSVGGLAILTVVLLRWWRRAAPQPSLAPLVLADRQRLLWWAAVMLCGLIGAALGVVTASEAAARFRAVTWGGTGAGAVMLAASLEVARRRLALQRAG
ncbi:MAG: DUF4184 family protein [Solirubrobacteraceae bacterium]|nr:DUF4184 family protein [Solirubrobacteraceae bacterium]